MKTVTLSEYTKEMDRIDAMQNRVGEILKSNWFVRWWNFREAIKLHNDAEKAMLILFSKELILDTE